MPLLDIKQNQMIYSIKSFCSVKRENEEEALKKENNEWRRRIYEHDCETQKLKSDCKFLDQKMIKLEEEVCTYSLSKIFHK